MQFSIFALGALAATAMASPLAKTSDIEARCTEYCSNSAGCVCVDWPSDCTAFYTVQPDDTCLTIAKSFSNFTVTQLYLWNPDMGQTCFGLRAYVPVCINTPDYTYVPPVQPDFGTHYTPDQIPVPVMPNIVSDCEDFELVAPGTRVDELGDENGFTDEEFMEWNGNSTTAWAAYWACVKA